MQSTASNIAAVVSSETRLYASTAAIYFGNTMGTNRSIEIEQGAVVSSGLYAVSISGNNFILENAGQISAQYYGVITQLSDATHSARIVNSGQIIGESSGMINDSSDFGTITLSNTGLIWGGSSSLESALNTGYRITNRGEMRGDVYLGDLADLVDNVGGEINGTMLMGGAMILCGPDQATRSRMAALAMICWISRTPARSG